MGYQSQGEVGVLQSQKVEVVEEGQGEGPCWDESWAQGRPWGEQEVGGLDSAY